jgi:urease accessory protein
MSLNRLTPLLGLAVLAMVLPTAAEAHVMAGEGGGFLHGFEHPLSGLDHMLAMFCVGLWGAQMGGRSVWSLPIAFPLIMVVGGMMGIAGVPLPAVESRNRLPLAPAGMAGRGCDRCLCDLPWLCPWRGTARCG